MIFRGTAIPGAWSIGLERMEDDRGFFARTWCAREFRDAGLPTRIAQCSLSYNRSRGTLRGLHYQAPPHAENKLVRCVRGAVHDVIVDLREESPAYMRHLGFELSAENRLALFVPEGCAHGFLTLEDDTEVLYQISEFYEPGAARGIRWDDPALGIEWPEAPKVISDRDGGYPDLRSRAPATGDGE